MESQPAGGGAAASFSDEIAGMKELRQHLEESIESRRFSQQELVSSLQTLIPDLVSSVDLALNLISAFASRPFVPTPTPNPGSRRRPPDRAALLRRTRPKLSPDRHAADGGDRLSVVRAMVAVCLHELTPFTEIDSASLLRRLESDQSSASPTEKVALADLGGIHGPTSVIDLALRRIADESGGVQLEELADAGSGKSVITVRAIDRNKLVKEFSESSQQPPARSMPLSQPHDSGPVDESALTPRPAEMWMSPMIPPASPMMGPRGMPRMMGSMGMPRMMGGPLHRPPRTPMGGGISPGNAKQRLDVDDLNDIEALVNKKTFREMQKSKTERSS